MGVVFACALSFMSKYLHQSCGPKPMTRVDINDNNQSSNTRLKHVDGDILIDDSFPGEHLFSLFVNTPWFAYMENYLATRKLPSHLSPHEKRRIIMQSANYSWVRHDLFRTGPDLIIRRCVREDEIPEIL
jgi:hypothetical protein